MTKKSAHPSAIRLPSGTQIEIACLNLKTWGKPPQTSSLLSKRQRLSCCQSCPCRTWLRGSLNLTDIATRFLHICSTKTDVSCTSFVCKHAVGIPPEKKPPRMIKAPLQILRGRAAEAAVPQDRRGTSRRPSNQLGFCDSSLRVFSGPASYI